MNFSIVGDLESPVRRWLATGIRNKLMSCGYQHCPQPVDDIHLVMNFMSKDTVRPYRRKEQATFVVGVYETDEFSQDVLKAGYPILVRSLSNLLLFIAKTPDQFNTYFVTLEQGYYAVPYKEGKDHDYFADIMERLEPLASSRLVINNEFHYDLPEELWEGDEVTRQLAASGRKLDELNLLPTPFPLEEILSPKELRHVNHLFGVGGLSYGNLSARKEQNWFWMSASGVDKGHMQTVGRDILLVTDYNSEKNAMIIKVPPHVQPRRVSVDAIEHWMIYSRHPEVGAIVHIHAWIDKVPATQVNYPCGTRELSEVVSELISEAEDPSSAIVGLRNHGLTITGPNLQDIFQRIEGRVIRQIPMA